MGGFAWVTLATNDSYSLGALVLAHSLRRVGTKYDLAVLVTPGVTGAMREKLASVFSLVQEVNVLDSKDEANLALLARPELGITFTKLHCWRLTQYEKCVFVDADTLVIRNCDELFEREELSAAPDVGWPDCFNSGVFVFKPSQQTFASITSFAAAKGSFDGGDQGLLNQYFSDWSHKDISKHLPFIYNMCSTATYSYLPAFKQFGDDVRIIHFIGITKPWLQYFDTLTGQVQPAPGSNHLQPLLQLWWNIFCENVHPELSPVMASSTLASVWHELNPLPSVNSFPRISHEDVNDFTYDNIESKSVPDFSEFQDPWDNYSERSNISILAEAVESNDNYHRHIEQNVSSNFSLSKNDSSDQTSAPFHYTHREQFTSQIRCVDSEKHDEYKVPSVLDNRQNNERQDNSQIYHEPSTEQRTCTIVIDHPHEHRHHRQETNYQIQSPSQILTNNREQVYHHDAQTNYNQEQEYRHNDQNNYNHEQDYRSNEQKNEENNYVHNEQEHRHHDHSFENAHQQRNDNFHHEEESHQHCHRKTDDLRDDAQASSHSIVTADRRETITQSRVINEENDRGIDQDRLQDQSNIDRNKKPTDVCTTKSHSPPEPCTKSKSIATQSEPNIAGQLESNDAGIAGALAKITLGEARSPEQVAFEEHMRKQSWEQGQIDYMGRDSFENIWKKISETLAVQPQRQPSPPKTVTKPEKTEIEVAPAVTSEDEPASKSEAAVLPEFRQKEEQDLISELAPALAKVIPSCAEVSSGKKSAETVPPQSFSSDAAVATVALTPTVPQLSSMESVGPPLSSQKNDNETSILTGATSTITKDSSIPQTCERLSQEVKLEEQPSKTDFPETPAAAAIVREEDKTLESQKEVKVETLESASSEIVSDSPVPIQVAESVLEAEVKESVTEDLRPVTEEAISSISTSAQESVPAVLETAMEALGPATPTPNSSAGLNSEIGNGIDALSLSSLPRVTSPASAVAEIAPEVVASLQTEQMTPAAQSEETCPLPVTPVESVPETTFVEQKEGTCSLPVKPVESVPEATLAAQKEETCPLPVKPVESVPEATPAEQKEETCLLPVKPVENVPETKLSTETEQSSISVIEPAEKLQEVKLPVEQVEKSQEVKLLAEAAQASLSSVKPLEKPQEVELPAETTQPTSLPVETLEKLQESTIATKIEQTNQSSVVLAEKPAETILPVEAEEPSLPTAETASSTKPEPIVCPMKLERKVLDSELPIKTEEPLSLPVAAPDVESKPDIASSTEESIEKKVPKDETKDVEVASEETASQSESSEESPVRPARTKDIQIPGTPIVIEATPPTSPPISAVEGFQDQPTKVTKKVVKKVVKKTTTSETKPAEGAEADAEGKKVTKKVVKKVVKKTKEDEPSVAESSSGNEKPKKVVKVVKKTTKASQSLEADTTVPETPPPGTSEVPVPPKRKLKTTTKSTTAKSDSEP